MRANGMAFCPRYDLAAESAGPDGTAETVGGLHATESDVETVVETGTELRIVDCGEHVHCGDTPQFEDQRGRRSPWYYP